MFLDSKEKFLLKKAKNKGAEALYESYLSIVERTGKNISEESIEYLQLFVQYDYKECTRIIRARNNDYLTLLPYEAEYLFLLGFIAAYYIDRNEIIKGLLWSMKSIDLCALIYPTITTEQREELQHSLVVAEVLGLYYEKYPIAEMYDGFFLDWEIKRGFHIDYKPYLNDN